MKDKIKIRVMTGSHDFTGYVDRLFIIEDNRFDLIDAENVTRLFTIYVKNIEAVEYL